MPKFSELSPDDVVIGRGRATAQTRRQFVEALRASDAGMIELERDDKPATVKRWLQEAAREVNVRVRSSWTDDRQRVLVWKKASTRS